MQALPPPSRRSLTSIFTLPSSILSFRSSTTSSTTTNTRASSKSNTPKTSRSSSRKSSFSYISQKQQPNEKHPIPFTATSPQDDKDAGESDVECWIRMLALQKQYHCYNSARLEAAVEALERGWDLGDIPMPSRYCLDLLNEELRALMDSQSFELDRLSRVSY